MNLLSISFLLFALGLCLAYFLVPARFRWGVLLAFSLAFYALGGWLNLPFLLLTAASIWGAALLIQKNADAQSAWLKAHKSECSKEEKAAYKARERSRRKRILVGALVLNFGVLCAFKYVHFLLAQADAVAGWFGGSVHDTVQWIIPLGISFYTFQSVGYLLDVFWDRCEAQRSFPKLLLFVCFFPQILQGPISSYSQLGPELYRGHDFDFDELCRGLRRMLWGFFKKLVIADALAPFVAALFADYPTYAGLAAFVGIALYSIQLYADFSGYMDIVCGLCRVLGIPLRENFDRPFFAHSVAEYWRRWHMSLGDWFKAYVYYPIAVSGWAQRLGKRARAKLGKTAGGALPATLALIVTWLATGLWHGASWGYVVWGGLNGAFLILSVWMEPVFKGWTARLRLGDDKRSWQLFRILRTNLLLVFLRILPELGGLRDGLGLWAQVFRSPTLPQGWEGWFPGGASPVQMLVVGFGFALMLAADGIKCRQPVQDWLDKRPLGLRFALYFVLLALILIFGCYGPGYDARDFMYFKF
jgi:D-alanyl-lipoteichoic acid acyltransferase DltB (MBOAT superfamily)